MKKMNCLSTVLFLGFTVSAFGGVNNRNTTLNLTALKAKCADLTANEQLKQFKAMVTCKQVLTEWRPSTKTADPIEMQNTKEIGAAFSLKGYTVPFQAEAVEVSPSLAACGAMEQVRVTVPAVDLELTCDALAQVEKLSDLCGPAIEERIKADPSIQVTEATGESFSSCQSH
ncbi:MAG: hypothetical protein NTX25_19910 [Proteobacteria bacterium]|nr:hypothetical protein [Pseudomonadota bacterium]